MAAYRADRGAGEAEPVFATSTGGHVEPTNFAGRIFRPAARIAGVPWASPHVLRHSYASRMVRSGVNAKQLQVLLGHATISMTLDTYSHLFDDDLPAALDETWSATQEKHVEAAHQVHLAP